MRRSLKLMSERCGTRPRQFMPLLVISIPRAQIQCHDELLPLADTFGIRVLTTPCRAHPPVIAVIELVG